MLLQLLVAGGGLCCLKPTLVPWLRGTGQYCIKPSICNGEFFAVVFCRYIVDRGDQELWDKVLSDDNKFRRQLIDQVS